MGLSRHLEAQAQSLLPWRSFLPLIFAPVIALAIADMRWPFGSAVLHDIWAFACLSVSIVGVSIRVWVAGCVPAGTSGRNTRGQCALSLNTTGPYSLMRHPLYLGNCLIGLGVVMAPNVWWLPLLYTVSFAAYYERIMLAEEAFLKQKFGTRFKSWSSITPAFFPSLSRWKKSELRFSIRNAMKREYTGVLVVALCYSSLEVAGHAVVEHRLAVGTEWLGILLVALTMYFTLRGLKKHTQLLNVAGR